MKFVLGLAAALGIIFIINTHRTSATQTINEMHQRAMERAELAKAEARNAEKVKIYIAGRDAKTCMEILKTTVINNKVIECNKDRTVEMRRDEIEAFKLEQRIQ